MKKIKFVLFIAFLPAFLFSAPKKSNSNDLIFQVEDDSTNKKTSNSSGAFGLNMGMTLSEIKNACNKVSPKQIEGDKYYVYPIKTHPLFKYYIAYVDDSQGLYCLQAVSDKIETNEYGVEIKEAFAEIKDRVSKTYGTPKMIDTIDPKSWWQNDSYWLLGISEGARTYSAIWDSQLKDDVSRVSIKVYGNSVWKYGTITLEYDFSNKAIVEDYQDDVF